MLLQLHISNLAVIEDVTIELSEGLNCFTGQTGAGKSLILGALEILLGMRSGNLTDMIRPGADEARVSGVFELQDAWVVQQVSAAVDQSIEPGDSLLITRRLLASGRSTISINGRPATAAIIRTIGELLVDVHGQHDHQYLLKASNQLVILDAFGQTIPLREKFMTGYAQLRRLLQRRNQLIESRTLRRRQLELYEFQADEIDAAAIDEPAGDEQVSELAELEARHRVISNIQRIKSQAGQAHAALYEAEGAAIERLQMIAHLLIELAEVDPALAPTAEQIRSSTLSLQESAYELSGYVQRLDCDPSELTEIEDRLNVLNRLIEKYGRGPGQANPAAADPLAQVIAYRKQIGQQIQTLRGENEDLEDLDRQIDSLQRELGELGSTLSDQRRQAAAKLSPLVEKELAELGMPDGRLIVELTSGAFDSLASGASGGGDAAIMATGLDTIEFMVRTNPGQPARPLRKIASGGELSRIMLAVKSILTHADRISVVVFDEIDANIGGRMGTVIGSKLRQLAAGGAHQVLCITHLPQIAAHADRHLRIAKRVEGKGKSRRTRTDVALLDGQSRIDELAEMLAGTQATVTTRKQARELIKAAG